MKGCRHMNDRELHRQNLLIAARFEGLEHRLLFATFPVTSNADSGAGTLRQAILNANGSAGPDVISFAIGSGIQTITPTSALATAPYTPENAVAFVHHMREEHPKAWGKYGFPNGYNPNRNWVDPDVIGIDLGMMLLNVENARNEFVHKLTSSHPAIQRGFKRLGFKSVPGSNKGPLVELGRE